MVLGLMQLLERCGGVNLNVKYGNITIVDMNFEENILVVLMAGKTIKASIQTDNNGQYIEVNNVKYYLSKLVYNK